MCKSFDKMLAIVLALVMCVSLLGCDKKNAGTDANGGSPSVANTLYVSSTEDGTKTVVDKDGNPVKGYALDDAGNIVDENGEVIVKAEQVAGYVPVKTTGDAESSKPSDSEPKGEENTAGTSSSEQSPSGTSGSSSNSNGSSSSSGSSSSGSSSSSNYGGSSGSSGSSNSSSGPSSSGGGNSQPVHTHNWQPVYKTIEIPVYEKVCYTVCAACGAKFGINNTIEEVSYHMEAHAIKGESSRTYTQYDDVQVGIQTVEDLDHYECSCGATKEV